MLNGDYYYLFVYFCSNQTVMYVEKRELLELIRALPEQCELEELQYKIRILEKLKRAEEMVLNESAVLFEEVEGF